MKLPANKLLKERARFLRQHSTLSEVLLWNMLKQKRVHGFDFDRQKVIGNYIVDFYCPVANLVVEIDGSSHDNKEKYDAKRDEYLINLGLRVLHIDDKAVKLRIDEVISTIETVISNHYPDTDGVTPSPAKGINSSGIRRITMSVGNLAE